MRLHCVVALALAAGLWACSGPNPSGDGGTGGGGEATGGGSGGGTAMDGGVDAGVPERILFLFDGSASMAVSDPLGSRAAALDAYLGRLPNDARVSVAVGVFSGSVIAILSPSGLLEFTPMPAWTAAERTQLRARLLGFVPPGTQPPVRDFVSPLSTAFELMYRETQQALTLDQAQARYTVIFVSDASPDVDQDDELLCGRAIERITDLADSSLGVRVHTAHVFMPTTPPAPTCTEDAGITTFPGSSCMLPTLTVPCVALQVEFDTERLRRMALVGGGRFLDFRSAPVDFSQVLP